MGCYHAVSTIDQLMKTKGCLPAARCLVVAVAAASAQQVLAHLTSEGRVMSLPVEADIDAARMPVFKQLKRPNRAAISRYSAARYIIGFITLPAASKSIAPIKT